MGSLSTLAASTSDTVSTAEPRLEPTFDADSVRDMKASATSDLTVGGPHLAAHAFEAGLVDECHLLIRPALVGGGKLTLPSGIWVGLVATNALTDSTDAE